MTEKEFVESFLSAFAKNITKKQRQQNHIAGKQKGYLWNLFGTKFVSFLEGDVARDEYNVADKTGAFEVLYDSPCLLEAFESESLNPEHLSAEGIDNSGLMEFYIIGKDFSWCYIVTHAGNAAGPYFCYAPKEYNL